MKKWYEGLDDNKKRIIRTVIQVVVASLIFIACSVILYLVGLIDINNEWAQIVGAPFLVSILTTIIAAVMNRAKKTVEVAAADLVSVYLNDDVDILVDNDTGKTVGKIDWHEEEQ